MPGSCSSDDKSSSPSLISTLRNFRFRNKTKNYQPGISTTSTVTKTSHIGGGALSTPKKLDSVSWKKSSSSSTVIKSSKDSFPSSCTSTVTSATSRSSETYSPLNYRKYEVSNSAHFLLQCILIKLQQVVKHAGAKNLVLELNFTTEEYQRLKEVLLQHTSLSGKWASHATEDPTILSNCQKVVKITNEYVKELLKYVRTVHSSSVLSNSSISCEKNSDSKPSVRTYSRVKKTVSSILTPAPQENHWESNIHENSHINQVPAGQNRGLMDDYEVFCEKEQNLRKLLDAFPGADIMEAQDILVRCDWDLDKAILVAADKPLRSTRKRSFSSAHSPPISGDNLQQSQGIPGNNQGSSSPKTSQASTKIAEEIVLDSSDEEVNKIRPKPIKIMNKSAQGTPGNPASKRPRRVVSSSESDDEKSLSRQRNTPVSSGQPSNTSTTSSHTITAVSSKTPNSNNAPVEKTISIPQSLTIKPIPNSSASNSEQPLNNKPVSNAIPNLPKGLVITQIQPSLNTSTNKSTNHIKTSEAVNSNTLSTSPVTALKTEASSTPSINKIVISNSNGNRSAHLVRIASANNSSGVKTINSNVSSVPNNKTLSVTPVSKSVSITPTPDTAEIVPAASSSREGSTDMQQDIKNASKSKNPKGKRKKLDLEDEDDEEYGNEDIYDSEDSECEENLTTAHNAVLKFFQDSCAEELGTIPGCSKKKVEAIMNVRPFSGWADLVEKLRNDKFLSTDLLNGAKKVIDMRNAINKLMAKCQQISFDMEDLVENLKENKESSSDYVSMQPDLLNDRMHLTSYQMLGLNWLLLMHNQEVNGILADEMGLGKTVQAIAFLAYLKEISISGPHLIVVPSSTLDNWKKELETWWPTVSVICYHGSQEGRRELRLQILNDEVDEFDVMITTYNMVASNAEDRSFFKRLEFHYVIFDEAHMLKNMSSQRYQNLMRIKAPRRLLLTGTPLQNNLVELMSLLIFAMPHMFSGKTEQIKQMFTCVTKGDGNKNSYEKDRIDHAKRIMKPFVLRRLKKEVLKELPTKQEETKFCSMVEDQAKKYVDLVATFSAEVQSNQDKDVTSSGAGMMMQLRRAANHPLLLKRFYDDDKLLAMSKLMLKEPTHTQSDPNLVFEDMAVMSDFELHKLCKAYKSLKKYILPDETILNSGKFKVFDSLLPQMFEEDHRILIFSQFTMVLDIVEEYMNIKQYKYLRLDGQTPVHDRQNMIDEFNGDPDIAVFLLSTRAGGLGINLTAADTVILHDIDFNPYNDKQAEDRCHRLGQVRNVRVIRLISEIYSFY